MNNPEQILLLFYSEMECFFHLSVNHQIDLVFTGNEPARVGQIKIHPHIFVSYNIVFGSQA